jgi:hypothetical protein
MMLLLLLDREFGRLLRLPTLLSFMHSNCIVMMTATADTTTTTTTTTTNTTTTNTTTTTTTTTTSCSGSSIRVARQHLQMALQKA